MSWDGRRNQLLKAEARSWGEGVEVKSVKEGWGGWE